MEANKAASIFFNKRGQNNGIVEGKVAIFDQMHENAPISGEPINDILR